MHSTDARRDMDDSGDLRRHQGPAAEPGADRMARDLDVQKRCAAAAVAGGFVVVVLLVANTYAAITSGPAIPLGINAVLVGLSFFFLAAWLLEWLSRGCRRYLLSLKPSSERGYGQGVLDGLALRADAGGDFGR